MDILKSKKFQAMLIGLLAVTLSHYVPEIDETTATQIVALVVSYIVGQGIADHGKEREKIKAANPATD